MKDSTRTAGGKLARRVLLLGWDAADWKMIDPLIERGLMPNLARFIEEGAMGAIASLNPMLSPMLWNSIATGKFADKHGVLGFVEPDGHGGVRSVSSASRRCKAIWNILSDQGLRAGVINWFASHPAERVNGFVVTDRFTPTIRDPELRKIENAVYPPDLADAAWETRVTPAKTTPQQIGPFIPRLAELDALNNEKVNHLRCLLAECATVHGVATRFMVEQEWDFLGVYYDTIDRFAHAFMEYHPPKMEHVSQEDFQLYKDVMVGCYRFHDMMLGRIMELVGDDTTIVIVSDHGFHCDHMRPKCSSRIKDGQPVAWHRTHGVLAVRGPNIKKDVRVYGAALIDVCPTILWLLGLPTARDMDGEPLLQLAEDTLGDVSPKLDTYETPETAAAGEESPEDPWVAAQMLAQLADLGYVDADARAEDIVTERHQNLGLVYASTGRPAEAIEQYRQVLHRRADDKNIRLALAMCQLQMGMLDECEKTVTEVLDAEADAARANLYMGMICFRRGDDEAALEHLLRAEQADSRMPGLHCQIGAVYLRRRRHIDAERAFRQALKIDPDNAEAHDGLGVVLRLRRLPARAVQEHMRSIALLHYRPRTHINLGLALAEVGRIDWAIRAFNVAIDMNPTNPIPHRCLAVLYERAKKDPQKAAEHSRKASELRKCLRPDEYAD